MCSKFGTSHLPISAFFSFNHQPRGLLFTGHYITTPNKRQRVHYMVNLREAVSCFSSSGTLVLVIQRLNIHVS